MLFLSVLTMPRLMPGSPGKSSPSGALGDTCDCCARNVRELAVLRIGEGELQVVADAEIQRHPRVDAVVVLREQADVGPVVRLPDRRVLRHRAGKAQQEVRVRVARSCSR